jgi:endonuclease III
LLEKKLFSEELGINLKSKKEEEVFKWFLASILFGKRISQEIAKRTYKEFEKENLTSPEKILQAGWNKLVEVLDRGGYTRYDFSTADRLLENMKFLLEKYGSLWALHNSCKSKEELERKLQEFKGIGPVTTNIFLRELRGIWKYADPEPSEIVKNMAKKLKIKLPKNRKSLKFMRLEAALIRAKGEFFGRK